MNNFSAQSFISRQENISSLKEEFFDFHDKNTNERYDNFFAWKADRTKDFLNKDWVLKRQYADELLQFFEKLEEEIPNEHDVDSLDPDQRDAYLARYFLLGCMVDSVKNQIRVCVEVQKHADKMITNALHQDFLENDEEGESHYGKVDGRSSEVFFAEYCEAVE